MSRHRMSMNIITWISRYPSTHCAAHFTEMLILIRRRKRGKGGEGKREEIVIRSASVTVKWPPSPSLIKAPQLHCTGRVESPDPLASLGHESLNKTWTSVDLVRVWFLVLCSGILSHFLLSLHTHVQCLVFLWLVFLPASPGTPSISHSSQ